MNTKPLPGLPGWVAHTPSKTNPEWHRLDKHIRGVTKRATEFADAFGGVALARYVGLLHDLGKFDLQFQEYLWRHFQADQGKGSRPQTGEAPHKQAGALVAWDAVPKAGRQVAQILFGHHTAILDEDGTHSKAAEWQQRARLSVAQMRDHARTLGGEFDPTPPSLAELIPAPHNRSKAAFEMYLRFVYSCLTDADSLDTERHMNPEQATVREAEQAKAPTIIALCDMLRAAQAALLKETGANDTPVNRMRRMVYEDCLRVAREKRPGVFTLTVPTGGGKTRSALAFALEHAAACGLRRVVYAAPFTTILDQTADVFEAIFGTDSRIVLEHHSGMDPDETEEDETNEARDLWRRLAAQTWDVPLIVTTQVQLFESLFSNRPGKCRKLHRLAQSVLILDEVQTLPPKLLRPLVDALQLLAQNFGVTVVLCTATQPALEADTRFFKGFSPSPVEIVSEPKKHFAALRRVRYQTDLDTDSDKPWNWERVAGTMRTGGSCLCILNTRRQAVELLDLLDRDRSDERVFHLSTLLCGRHRRAVLREITQRLKEKKTTWLVSTTVVEAGVNLDFPRLLRALAPLPSLIQGAGRCNREGELRDANDNPALGEVLIFRPADDVTVPDTVYKAARRLTENRLNDAAHGGGVFAFDDPDTVTAWFRDFVHDLGNQVDASDIRTDINNFAFDAVARKMRLIPDETVSVLPLAYAENEATAILDAAEFQGGMTRDLWRKAQPLCVSVYACAAEGLEERFPGLFLWPGRYDSKTGIPLLSDPADGVVYEAERLIVGGPVAALSEGLDTPTSTRV